MMQTRAEEPTHLLGGDLVNRTSFHEDSFVPVALKKRRLSEKLAVLLVDLDASGCKDVVESKLRSTAHHTVHSLRTAREALSQFKPDILLVSKPASLSVDLTFSSIPTVLLVNDSAGDGFQLELPKGCNDYILLSELSDPVLRWTESRAKRVVKPSPTSPEHLAKMVDILSAQDGKGYWVCEKGADQPLYVSGSCAQVLERSFDETKRILTSLLQYSGFVHPNDLGRYVRHVQEGLQVGGKASFQCKILVPHDQERSVHLRLESHQDSSNKVVHYGSIRVVDTAQLSLNQKGLVILKDRSNLEEKCTCHDVCSCESESASTFPSSHRKRNPSHPADTQKLAERVKSLEHALGLALKESNTKARFVEFVSHEVRTLLNGIVGAVELFDISRLNESEVKYIDMINTSCTSILRVLNDVLTYAKMEAGMVQIKPAPFDLRKFVDQVTIAYKDRDNAITFKTNLAKEVPSVIKADAVRLRQVLSNLLNNAYNFTRSGSVHMAIDVLSLDGSAVKLRFAVEDTGVGISEDAISTLFNPFTQAQGPSLLQGSGAVLGTGLGLNISHTLVDLMGGTLEVESTQSKGSVFSFVLPVECCDICPRKLKGQRLKEERSDESLSGEFASLRVLVADDDPLGQTLLLRMLLKLGCSVDVANNGQEAVAKIQKDGVAYDLVLMDCDMPVVSGYTATSQIRKWESTRISGSKRKTLIYACTAHVLQSNVARCLDAGMDSYLTKPLRLSDLRSACEKAVSLKGLN